MEKNTAIPSVVNNINKFHIQSDLHLIKKKNFYHVKEREIDKLFDEYHLPLLQDIDHPALIQERKWNIYATAYQKS